MDELNKGPKFVVELMEHGYSENDAKYFLVECFEWFKDLYYKGGVKEMIAASDFYRALRESKRKRDY